MQTGKFARVINMQSTRPEDGWGRPAYNKMVQAQVGEVLVEVLCEACEGYSDVRLPDGTVVRAVSHFHLAEMPVD